MKIRIASVIFFLLNPLGVIAQPEDNRNPDYYLTLYTQVERDDNATRAADPEVSEIQNQFGARIGFDYRTSESLVDIDYDVRRNQFSEDSQEDETTIIGTSTLDFGAETNPVGISFFHSLERILNQPEDAPLISNSQNRQTISVSPRANMRLSEGTFLTLKLTKSEIDFEDSIANDSSRTGLELNFNRLIGAGERYGIGYSFFEIDFVNNDEFSYEQQRIFGLYSVDFEKFDYLIRIGTSKTESDNVLTEDSNDLFFEIEANYNFGVDQFSLTADQSRTDSSVGIGSASLQDAIISSGGSTNTQDQIDRQSISLTYLSRSVCSLCRIRLFSDYEELDYLVDSENDQERTVISAEFNYDLTRNFRFTTIYRLDKIQYPSDQVRDFERTTITANLLFEREVYEVLVGYENQDQSFDNPTNEDYTANIVRLRFDRFF